MVVSFHDANTEAELDESSDGHKLNNFQLPECIIHPLNAQLLFRQTNPIFFNDFRRPPERYQLLEFDLCDWSRCRAQIMETILLPPIADRQSSFVARLGRIGSATPSECCEHENILADRIAFGKS